MNKVRGFRDIFGDDIAYWQTVESRLIALFQSFGYAEFRIPILEKSELFNRGIGDTTDIVEKEMFTFTDRNDESLSLRPEGTASLIRAYVENKLHNPPAVKKYYYKGEMFRRERPQKGRFRQFTQAGIEALESSSPILDAEVISILFQSAKVLGFEHFVKMQINSIGCKSCRPIYNEKLKEFFRAKYDILCEDCKRRLEKNPLRLLDCKVESCINERKDLPLITDHLCEDCEVDFAKVQEYLKIMKTPFTINKFLVRGLDYYVKTSFELITDKLGAASAVGAGGRYDGLVKIIGGNDTAGIGFAIGVDRMVELLKLSKTIDIKKADIFFITVSEFFETAYDMINELRGFGKIVEYDYDLASIKSQMKKADRSGAKITIILCEDEMKEDIVTIKNMATGEQNKIKFSEVIKDICYQI